MYDYMNACSNVGS